MSELNQIEKQFKEIRHLKAENEKLKQECDLYKTWYRAKHDDLKNFLGKLKVENEDLQEMNRNLSEKFANVCGGCFEQELREKYKQCLDEIENLLKKTQEYSSNLIHDEILQKIKEVKDNE